MLRARFHIALAQLGKTNLDDQERQWLAPNDVDGGMALLNLNVSNNIFLYEQTTLRNDTVWQELADFLSLSHIPNVHYEGSKGRTLNKNICLPEYDYFRSVLMVYSYQLSRWMQDYFFPVAKDPSRPDVFVGDIERVEKIIATSYQQDPCNRLILQPLEANETRMPSNIKYILDPALKEAPMWIPSEEYIANLTMQEKILQEEKKAKAAQKEDEMRRRKEKRNVTVAERPAR